MNEVEQVLQEKFGFSSFRSGQEEAIQSVLAGQDTLVMLPTGTGKSLCYQLPAYLLDGVVLIVSPLLSLMQDQVESLQLKGEKRVATLNSLTSASERRRILNQLSTYRFIYTSPEMLQNDYILTALRKAKISLFVVDEAHCISHWGTDFRPDYLDLADVRQELGKPTTMALTATATKKVRSEIIHFLNLNIEETKQIIQSVDRKEIKFIVKNCHANKEEILLDYIQEINGPGIIYFMSKKLADEWASTLKESYQIQAVSYHADIAADDKTKIQQQFLNNEIQIICATSAFGMGIDKKDIRYVIHYHMPASLEMYLQEVGRASRDGEASLAILLYQSGDEYIQERFIEVSLPGLEHIKKAYHNKKKSVDFEDTRVKLATYFSKSAKNIDEVMNIVTARKQTKTQQLAAMMHYIFCEGCKREYILAYFGEGISEKPEVCCSNCGFEVDKFIEELNLIDGETTFDKKSNTLYNWEQVFQALYNNQ